MILYALYYYDRPLLAAWLNHYCQLECIDEIIIQNQNWSIEDSSYLVHTIADFIDEYKKKIGVLPSNFERVEGENKRSQFLRYGQSTIRNRVMQFLKGQTWIAGSMDEVIYGESYEQTDRDLKIFEEFAEGGAKRGRSTIGFVPLYCVYKEGFYPCNGIPIVAWKIPNWRHRLFRFTMPFRRAGSKAHDTTYQAFIKKEWVAVTPRSAAWRKEEIKDFEFGVPLENLKLLHYHTLVRDHRHFDSAKFIFPRRGQIKNLKEHPKAYLDRLIPP